MKYSSNVFNCDCVAGMERLPSDSIDLTVTSPPYDNLRDYKGYCFNWESVIDQLERITKVGGGSRVDSFRPNHRRK